jgi:hypothetical protein
VPGDPRECRKHALRCAELAMTSRTEQLKAKFLALSKHWEALAVQLEDVLATLAESKDTQSIVQETLDASKRLSSLLIEKDPIRKPTRPSIDPGTARRRCR